MYQYSVITIADIIRMVILYFKVVDFDGVFKDLVLDLFNGDVFAVYQLQTVTGAEVNSFHPAAVGFVTLFLI